MRKPLIAGTAVVLGLWLSPIASSEPAPPAPPDPCAGGLCHQLPENGQPGNHGPFPKPLPQCPPVGTPWYPGWPDPCEGNTTPPRQKN
jgi:hypothetical protein